MAKQVTLFVVSACGGPKPDEPAKVCEFPAIEGPKTFRWKTQSRHDVGVNLMSGRCGKKDMRAGDGTVVYRTRDSAVEAYRRNLAERIRDSKRELARLEKLVQLGVRGAPVDDRVIWRHRTL